MSSYGDGLMPGNLEAAINAASYQFDVIQSTEMVLLVDLDTPEALAQFRRVLPKVIANYGIANIQTWKSKSGNTHKLIRLTSPLPVETRIALQAALGSDGVREVLSLKRRQNGCDEPCLLFRPTAANVLQEDIE